MMTPEQARRMAEEEKLPKPSFSAGDCLQNIRFIENQYSESKVREAVAAALVKLTQGQEPVAWLVTGPYTRQAFADESAANAYCRGLAKGHGENLYSVAGCFALPSQQEERKPLMEAEKDDVAVDQFAQAMKEKLAKAREKGRSGWQTCDPHDLSSMLVDHIEKGDPRDVANFCMFLWNLGCDIAGDDYKIKEQQ